MPQRGSGLQPKVAAKPLRWVANEINRAIPKGLCPSAQGWRAAPTLGHHSKNGSNANGVVADSPTLRQAATLGHQSNKPNNLNEVVAVRMLTMKQNGHNRVAVGTFIGRSPRVAQSAQPWALGRNPVGILRWRDIPRLMEIAKNSSWNSCRPDAIKHL
jgi:hypothetical protein